MPVQVIWDDEAHTRLHQVYSGTLTIDDYITATNEIERMAKTVPHTIYTIMDRMQVLSTPGVLIPALRYANKHVPPNLGVRVIIRASSFTRAIVDIGKRVAPRLVENVYFASNLEEARALIEKHTEVPQRILTTKIG
jgi:hypothetical protein